MHNKRPESSFQTCSFFLSPFGGTQMTSPLTTFLAAVSAASAVCYLLMTRMENRRARRVSQGGRTGSSDGGYTSDSDGWSLGGLFGQVTDACGGWDSGSGDSGGDCGGGDGGGGGD
jgi:hypothetical protein